MQKNQDLHISTEKAFEEREKAKIEEEMQKKLDEQNKSDN